jgi:hypothetical protein
MFRNKKADILSIIFCRQVLVQTEIRWQLNSGMFFKLLHKEDAEGHRYMEYCNTRTLSLTNSGALPKYSQQSSFISVQEAGFKGSDVSTCAYKQQDYSQQNLKFENGRHSEASNAPHITLLPQAEKVSNYQYFDLCSVGSRETTVHF